MTAEYVGSYYELARIPKDPRPQVALAGRSNVGKSSLLNKLVGQKGLAKVSGTPGKTRSLNFFLVNENFYLVDLPGYGYARVPKAVKESWGELVEQYLTGASRLIGLVLLLDSRRDPTPEDAQMLEWLAARELPALIVLTKADKLKRSQINQKVQQVERDLQLSAIPTSVKSGMGKNDLVRAIVDLVEESSTR
ncbi:YihA family ribosome biogenesis GTP-binding protein [candidate division GN15 bacterium]|nr:YihA family ribosome biogenesis GTP-binding protein [candidate division GN15 bacterium]